MSPRDRVAAALAVVAVVAGTIGGFAVSFVAGCLILSGLTLLYSLILGGVFDRPEPGGSA